MGAYPLADRTESRYGEIARKMLETGDWITPQIDYGVPFWGKPPLSTWLTAGSFQLFGVNEFSARFSSFILIFLSVCLVYAIARERGANYSILGAMVAATTAGFFVSSGTVMTDPALVFGITLSMVGFWQSVKSTSLTRLWGYSFFIGIAIAVLAKGPVGIVLIFFPIIVWSIWQKKLNDVWQRIPWFSGTILLLLIALPWYVLAEVKTPGFIDYFLVGEHWKRFTESGWTGDLYGSGHAHPHGTIWLYWLLAAFPWSFLGLGLIAKMVLGRSRQHVSNLVQNHREWITYLLLWAITPMLVFTFASNILWTYVLPGLPAFALLMSELLLPWPAMYKKSMLYSSIGLVVPLVFLLAFPVVVNVANQNSHKNIVSSYHESCNLSACQLVYMFGMPYSAEFYSRGKAIEVDDVEQAIQLLEEKEETYFVVKSRKIDELPEEFTTRIENVAAHSGITLFRAV
ncbi:MAG: ArnT family glycosyltransferase [Synechococcus sp.]